MSIGPKSALSDVRGTCPNRKSSTHPEQSVQIEYETPLGGTRVGALSSWSHSNHRERLLPSDGALLFVKCEKKAGQANKLL